MNIMCVNENITTNGLTLGKNYQVLSVDDCGGELYKIIDDNGDNKRYSSQFFINNVDDRMKFLDLLVSIVRGECGDGDAIWLSKHISISDLVILIKKYNENSGLNWQIVKYDKYIAWGEGEQWIIITNDEMFFKSQPDCILIKIDF